MRLDGQALVVTVAIFGVLTLATLVERVLAMRAPADVPNPTLENLRDRINAWWVMVRDRLAAFLARPRRHHRCSSPSSRSRPCASS